MRFTANMILLFSIVVFSGGLMGYFQKASLPSLISGIVFGLILFLSSFGLARYDKKSFFIAFTFTAFLLLFFAFRFFQSFKWMPAGMMMILSASVLLLLLSTKAKNRET